MKQHRDALSHGLIAPLGWPPLYPPYWDPCYSYFFYLPLGRACSISWFSSSGKDWEPYSSWFSAPRPKFQSGQKKPNFMRYGETHDWINYSPKTIGEMWGPKTLHFVKRLHFWFLSFGFLRQEASILGHVAPILEKQEVQSGLARSTTTPVCIPAAWDTYEQSKKVP